MKRIWTYINDRDWTEYAKYRVFLMVIGTLSAAAGLGLWLIVRNRMLSAPDWMICFIGYPVAVSCFAAMIYSLKHDFK